MTLATVPPPEQGPTDHAHADGAELRALAERYAAALDRGDREDYLSVFTRDGVVVIHGPDGSVVQERRGPAELLKEFDDLGGFDRVHHLVGGHVAEVTDGGGSATAVVSAEAHHHSTGTDGNATDLYCPVRYHDSCVRTAEGWRIARREVFPLWYDLRTVTAPRW